MNKYYILFAISLIVLSCNEIDQNENLKSEIARLKIENDSLKFIQEEISQKYVFDSISLRVISDSNNTNKVGSKLKGEIVYVGYNGGNDTSMIVVDSITYENGETLHNPDTLLMYKGGFKFEKNVEERKTLIKIVTMTKNKFGKGDEGILWHSELTK